MTRRGRARPTRRRRSRSAKRSPLRHLSRPPPGQSPRRRLPRRFLALAALVACHRDPARWAALYQVLWRLTRGGEPRLLAVSVDPDVLRLTRMAKAVRREVHRMHAFVRFREAPSGDTPVGAMSGGAPDAPEFVAWFEPEHDVVARAAPFFVRRFPNARWALLTPRGTARWDGTALALGPGVPAGAAPRDDSLEALWGVYYAHIFNPARVKLAAMHAGMPRRYWRNLPEARLVGEMVRGAPARVRAMVEAGAGGGSGPRAWSGAGVPGARDGAAEPPRAEPPRVEAPIVEAPIVEPPTTSPSVCLTHGAHACAVYVGTVGWGGPGVTPEAATRGNAAAGDGASGGEPPDGDRLGGTAEARLRAYATRFPLVEVDGTHQALPTRRLAALWAAWAPPGFVFDVRAHAALAGYPVEPRRLPRRLRDLLPPSLAGAHHLTPDEVPPRVREAVWADFLGALEPLAAAGKLGAIHLRLPGWIPPGRAAVDALVLAREALGGRPAAVEFQHRDWFAPRVRGRTLALLERLGFAHTVVDATAEGRRAGPLLVAEVTHPALAVVRLHGRREEAWEPAEERDQARGPAAELAEVARGVAAVAGRARRVHVLCSSGHAAAGGMASAEALRAAVVARV